jgi:RNA polymerase sigma-70 factor (ECF subfamily)
MKTGIASENGEYDDATLAQSVARGDCRAFEVLMRRYNQRLYRLARAALHDDAEAKDALQDAYLSAYRSIGQFRGDAALGTWLSRLVLNECGARRRRSARRDNIVPIVSLESNVQQSENVVEAGNAPEGAVTRMQVREILERKVGELPDILRVVFVLRSVDELSVQETAEVLGVPQETVRSRHFRAKALLREALAREVDVAERDIYEFGGNHCNAMVAAVLAKVTPATEVAP